METATSAPGAPQPIFPVHDITPRAGTVGGSILAIERIDDDLAFRAPHRHAFTQLVLIEAGSGFHSIDFVRVPIRPGELHLLAPGQVHEWQADPGLQCTALMFSEDVLDTVGALPDPLREMLLLGAAPIAPTSEGVLRQRRLLDAIGDAGSLASARHLLAALLHECADALPAQGGLCPHSSLTRSFMRDVLRAPDARLTVSSCAARLGVTSGYLAEQVVADTGSTPGRILRTAVAREAKRLLSGSDLSAAQVSSRLGFNEASYFSRFFRREVGCTPTEYREIGAPGTGAAHAEHLGKERHAS